MRPKAVCAENKQVRCAVSTPPLLFFFCFFLFFLQSAPIHCQQLDATYGTKSTENALIFQVSYVSYESDLTFCWSSESDLTFCCCSESDLTFCCCSEQARIAGREGCTADARRLSVQPDRHQRQETVSKLPAAFGGRGNC